MYRWLAVMLLFSGCAFGLSGPDPDRPRGEAPKCDTGKGLVALDAVVAATAGLIAVGIAGDTEPAVALLPLSIGAIYAAGAVRGNNNVNKCRAAFGEYESYASARETLPPMQTEDVETGRTGRTPRPREPIASRGNDVQVGVQTQPAPAPVPAPVPVQPPAPVAAPATAEDLTPGVAPQAPAAAKKPSKPTKQTPAPKQEPADDDWSDFWREVE